MKKLGRRKREARPVSIPRQTMLSQTTMCIKRWFSLHSEEDKKGIVSSFGSDLAATIYTCILES
jgi:hypothetical protein